MYYVAYLGLPLPGHPYIKGPFSTEDGAVRHLEEVVIGAGTILAGDDMHPVLTITEQGERLTWDVQFCDQPGSKS